MSKLIDLTGQRFERLTVVERAENTSRGNSRWRCICDCGNEIVVRGADLRNGHTKSCGCYSIETRTTHGEYGTRVYRIWQKIKDRCYNENNTYYSNYGGRNISVCEEWRNSFEAFRDWAIEHGYTDELSIDRIDVNGDYEPSNCRWATIKEQQNNRRNNRLITYNGKTQTMSQWAEEIGLSDRTLKSRLDQCGWSVEEALSIPVGKPRKQD